MFKGWLNLFIASNCPLCERSTTGQFCYDCERQLQRCQLSNPTQFWRKELPVFAWGMYGGVLKRSLKMLKYDLKTEIARPLGFYLAQAWLKSAPIKSRKLTVVPIPLHARKLSQRGFNQTQLLGQSFCQVTKFQLRSHGLERVRDTQAQFTQSAVERKQNLAGAFELGKDFEQRRPQTPILLLDDIYTTGATAISAAETLRQHGIEVCGIVAIATSMTTKLEN